MLKTSNELQIQRYVRKFQIPCTFKTGTVALMRNSGSFGWLFKFYIFV
jgi:hypothetical protein